MILFFQLVLAADFARCARDGFEMGSDVFHFFRDVAIAHVSPLTHVAKAGHDLHDLFEHAKELREDVRHYKEHRQQNNVFTTQQREQIRLAQQLGELGWTKQNIIAVNEKFLSGGWTKDTVVAFFEYILSTSRTPSDTTALFHALADLGDESQSIRDREHLKACLQHAEKLLRSQNDEEDEEDEESGDNACEEEEEEQDVVQQRTKSVSAAMAAGNIAEDDDEDDTKTESSGTSDSTTEEDVIDSEQLYNLGEKHKELEQYSLAISYYKKAADQEHELACLTLGELYFEGKTDDDEKNYQQAIDWYRRAEALGNTLATQWIRDAKKAAKQAHQHVH